MQHTRDDRISTIWYEHESAGKKCSEANIDRGESANVCNRAINVVKSLKKEWDGLWKRCHQRLLSVWQNN